MGFGGASAVLVAMIASLTILPAILALLGEKVNLLSVNSFLPWRKNRPAAAPGEEIHSGYWYRISQFVMRRPILVLVLTLVPVLGVLSFPLAPMLYALGKAGGPLRARLIASVVFFATLAPLSLAFGVVGAAVAFVLATATNVGVMIAQLLGQYLHRRAAR